MIVLVLVGDLVYKVKGKGLKSVEDDYKLDRDCYKELGGDLFDLRLFFGCPNIIVMNISYLGHNFISEITILTFIISHS